MITVLFTLFLVAAGVARRGHQPWPELAPHAYRCHECRIGYGDARAIVWHRQGQHVETYERSES